MQEARRLRPRNASALIGLLTAGYGLGQILGPALVAWILPRTASVAQGFEQSLHAAAGGLVLGLMIYAGLAWHASVGATGQPTRTTQDKPLP
jgi:uncharacterized iron-regulated membrane protein